MIKIPEVTKLEKPQRIDKKSLLENLTFSTTKTNKRGGLNKSWQSTKMGQQGVLGQIQKIQITHQIDSNSINMPTGVKVKQIMVMHILLKDHEINPELLVIIDEQIGMYLIFIVEDKRGGQRLFINLKEPLTVPRNGKFYNVKKTFESRKGEELLFKGNNLDDVYENLIKDIWVDELTSTVPAISISEMVEINDEIAKIEKKAEQLKKKMFSEKSMQKQMEVKRERAEILGRIEELKGER